MQPAFHGNCSLACSLSGRTDVVWLQLRRLECMTDIAAFRGVGFYACGNQTAFLCDTCPGCVRSACPYIIGMVDDLSFRHFRYTTRRGTSPICYAGTGAAYRLFFAIRDDRRRDGFPDFAQAFVAARTWVDLTGFSFRRVTLRVADAAAAVSTIASHVGTVSSDTAAAVRGFVLTFALRFARPLPLSCRIADVSRAPARGGSAF